MTHQPVRLPSVYDLLCADDAPYVENPDALAAYLEARGVRVGADAVEAAPPSELALRNCLAMAQRMLRRPGADEDGLRHIIRFCKEAGVELSFLRGEGR